MVSWKRILRAALPFGLAALLLGGFVCYELLFMEARFGPVPAPQAAVSVALRPVNGQFRVRVTNTTAQAISYSYGDTGRLSLLTLRLERRVTWWWWRHVSPGILVTLQFIARPPLAAGASREHRIGYEDVPLRPGLYRGCLRYWQGAHQMEQCSPPAHHPGWAHVAP